MRLLILCIFCISICYPQIRTNNYSLGMLGYVTGQNSDWISPTSLSSCGNRITDVRMSYFKFSGVNAGIEYIYYNPVDGYGPTNKQLTFNNEGTLFYLIKNQERNYSISGGVSIDDSYLTINPHNPVVGSIHIVVNNTTAIYERDIRLFYIDRYNYYDSTWLSSVGKYYHIYVNYYKE